jgi:hypothetical protein
VFVDTGFGLSPGLELLEGMVDKGSGELWVVARVNVNKDVGTDEVEDTAEDVGGEPGSVLIDESCWRLFDEELEGPGPAFEPSQIEEKLEHKHPVSPLTVNDVNKGTQYRVNSKTYDQVH